MATMNDRLNASLNGVWNIDDPVFKTFISDKDGIIPGVITKPSDIDIGAIASNIEWLRLLSLDLLEQMYVNKATGSFLTFILDNYFGIQWLEGETEESWVYRAQSLVFKPRVSRASIIYALRRYSSLEPIVSTNKTDSMFADVSFADRYKKDLQTYKGDNFFVFPAISQTFDSSFFSFVVTLFDTSDDDLFSVVSILENYIAAGITYIIKVERSH